MKKLTITAIINCLTYDELKDSDKQLIDAAKESTRNSYIPYSQFAVGAAARLTNGIVIQGNNQENAAYPSGICAERTTLFYANSKYPDQAVETLAVAAYTKGDFLDVPISPCGACRQVILEVEKRYNHPVRILLYGTNEIYEIKSIRDLLPLSFDEDFLK
ncbi:MAG: cytidine deaminase [Bacteroidales bacterium]|nr:cytidine deaminase [Bacteroidales bacterium]